jgi:cell division protein ZapE
MSTAPELLSPLQRYQRDLTREDFQRDESQAQAIEALQRVYEALLAAPPKRRLGSSRLKWPRVAGLYMWGGVGRGKTYLMDTFYESLPFSRKMRTHFHRFMLEVHERRQHYAHETDPIGKVALEFAAKVRVLCFDEFYVSDIADAMILGRLTEVLFENGVTLIATSNVVPDNLYKDGLQRANFLPAIDRLKKSVKVLNVDGGVDHRLRALTRAEVYHYPCDAAAEQNMLRDFVAIAGCAGQENVEMPIHDRIIVARRLADGVAWFEFAAICEGPRSAADYIQIGRTHHTVLLSKVPQLTVFSEDAARRFINLVDEFYDRGVKLIILADVPQEKLYAGLKLRFEFQRTLSRLQEMQSQEYLAKPHLA